MRCLDRKDDLDAHILSLMHDLTINNRLMSTDSITDRIRWVRSCSDLDLAPLTVGRHIFALDHEVLELFVDALLLNATLSLDKWRFWRI